MGYHTADDVLSREIAPYTELCHRIILDFLEKKKTPPPRPVQFDVGKKKVEPWAKLNNTRHSARY